MVLIAFLKKLSKFGSAVLPAIANLNIDMSEELYYKLTLEPRFAWNKSCLKKLENLN